MPIDTTKAMYSAKGMRPLLQNPYLRRKQRTHRVLRRIETNPAIDQLQMALDEPAHGQRIDLVLFSQYPLREARLIIAIEHRHGRLHDDRAVIERRRHEMNRTAMHANAFLQGAPVRMQTGEGRQQGGMDIDQTTSVMPDKTVTQN